MKRELATEWQDRPHAPYPVTQLRVGAVQLCSCCRPLDHELHSVEARELAAEHSTGLLVTEKGS